MKTRVISALIAVLIMYSTFYFWRVEGLLIICSLAIAGGIFEYSRLTLVPKKAPLHLRLAFFVFTLALFLATLWVEALTIPAVALGSVFFLTMSLMIVESAEGLPKALEFQSLGILGLLYCGLFPGLGLRILRFESGPTWFLGLLAIVFSGDTFAYLSGRAFGSRKLLEPVSPKKTVEGSLGGLVGSAIAGAALGAFFLPEIPLVSIILVALVTGAFAQVGDLFESLIKRVADVKDSGSIMPGHGGVLDRLDGVFFAAPVYYVLVRFLI
jgi:phosphatidate cytidylyltransferase